MMTPTWTLACVLLISGESRPGDYFAITVVDQLTGRGVPLVELRTVNDLRYYTDSNGVVAFSEPGLMDRDVFFHITSHGYEFPKDGFGFRGQRLYTTPGGEVVLKINRVNIAERLYRLTGGGIYSDSLLVGKSAPISQPLLRAQVLGSDSVQNFVFHGQLYWFWGDTNRPSYPLGNFHVPGATSRLPGANGPDPALGVELSYFVGPDGFAKSTCQMPGEGPTWVDGLVAVKDDAGRERLFAHYVKVKPPLTVYQHGLAEFHPEREEFEQRCVFPDGEPYYPGGHAFLHTAGGTEYVYFAKPFPLARVRANPEALQDLAQYEVFTCFPSGSRDRSTLDRQPNGKLHFGWKRDALPLTHEALHEITRDGKLSADERVWNFRDFETGKSIRLQSGSMYWNAYRQRWIVIASELFGASVLGEVWYAEAAAPAGPWAYARKIVTHNRQSFYNPKQHPFFAQEGGRIIFFEGTYTNTFSGNDDRTPRYNYNQLMYRLDLSDPRIVLPVPVYRRSERIMNGLSLRPPDDSDPTFGNVAFFACDRSFPGSVAVRAEPTADSTLLSVASAGTAGQHVLFYALPASIKDPPATSVPLFEHTDKNRRRRYRTGEETVDTFQRSAAPLCRVWAKPGN